MVVMFLQDCSRPTFSSLVHLGGGVFVRNRGVRPRAEQGTGKLSMVVWNRFLHHLMPRATQQERALYFEIASGFAENLDVLGFMDLRQVRLKQGVCIKEALR